MLADFIYAGSLRDPASLEVLLDALCLAKYWDMDEFVEAAQDCIAVHWLHPDTESAPQLKLLQDERN